MATKRLPMRQIRGILRLKHEQKLSHRAAKVVYAFVGVFDKGLQCSLALSSMEHVQSSEIACGESDKESAGLA